MGECPVCLKESRSVCSFCRKVAYCGKEHQKKHRKTHKSDCYPAVLRNHPVLGNHLTATRKILAGEKIFTDLPLVMGPRSNFPDFRVICLGCCGHIEPHMKKYLCSRCRWPVCNESCEKSSIHAEFECPIFEKANVKPAVTQDEYLCVTFLRCILLMYLGEPRWKDLLEFESHVESRRLKTLCLSQSTQAVDFIRNRCQLDVEASVIDFVYGIVLVNGYGDESTCAVKLYGKSAKVSHACIPNTRTVKKLQGLELVATIDISEGQPLTQLYGRIFKGTHKRQELLQNVYYFSCSCDRCVDPTELGTYFSAIKCHKKKCSGCLLPKVPLDITPASKWECNHCRRGFSYLQGVVPALQQIEEESKTNENDMLYTSYEIYEYENPDVPSKTAHALSRKIDIVEDMLKVLKKLETQVVHRNHYALLPLKTSIIATIHSVLTAEIAVDADVRSEMLENYTRMVKELLQVVDTLLPGMTSERGLLLFYLAESIKFSIGPGKSLSQGSSDCLEQLQKQMKSLQEESVKILMLDDEDDDHRKLVLQHVNRE